MPALQTDVSVCNLAIGRVGGEPIEALGEDTPLGAFCQTAYPAKRRELLGLYDWLFAKRYAQLSQTSPTPPGVPLKNLFAPPSDLVGAVRAFRGGPSEDSPEVRCLTSNVGIASNHGAVWAEYTAEVPEAAWPVWFVGLIESAFGAVLAGRRPDRELQQTLDVEAFGTPDQARQGGKFLLAMQADGRQAPPRQLFSPWDQGELVSARTYGYGVGLLGARFIAVDTSNG